MIEVYKGLKGIVGKNTHERFEFILNETKNMELKSKIYKIISPRGEDNNLVVSFNYGNEKELWITSNYDTYGFLPSANNNSSGVITLLGLAQKLKENSLPIDIKIIYFDAALDPLLAEKGKRNR